MHLSELNLNQTKGFYSISLKHNKIHNVLWTMHTSGPPDDSYTKDNLTQHVAVVMDPKHGVDRHACWGLGTISDSFF